jgi:selenocysteine lyase/cysteine desulfurase
MGSLVHLGSRVYNFEAMSAPLTSWRSQFPTCTESVHMNHAGISPVPRRVAEALRSFADGALHLTAAVHRSWERRAEETRAAFARLIGARAAEIAFVANTSQGLSMIAAGMRWKEGDNVVALEDEYPSNVYPWWALRRWGVETRMVPRPQSRFGVDEVRPFIDDRTRLLAVSAVDWQTGFRADLGALASLCRERDVLLCVDGIQAVGAMVIDVAADGIDCLVTGGHKWLLAAEGSGAMFLSRRALERVEPVIVGWKSVHDQDTYLPHHFDLRDDAAAFEPGSPPHVSILALGAAVDLLLEVGPKRIEREVLDLTLRLAEGLRERGATIVSPWGANERSSILTFRLGDPQSILNAFAEARIVARPRGGGIRLAPHFYNDEDDVARVLDAVDAGRGA